MSDVQINPPLNDEITISAEAVEQLLAIIADEPEVEGVRVFVSGGGCSGMEYGMTLVEQPSRFDFIYKAPGLDIYIDSVALSFLEGVEIDYKSDGLNRNFVFKNVFANSGGAGTCGTCGAVGGGCGS